MMDGHYDPRLVVLSVAIAIVASYTALDLTGCVSSSTSSPRKSWIWLAAGAVSLGTGIWSVIGEFAEVSLLLLDKHLVVQILSNLIGNAGQATNGVAHRPHQVKVCVDTVGRPGRTSLRVRVEDNGEGIFGENLERLFVHGFMTRNKGHGFGLHSCVLAAKEMGGGLAVHSGGSGKGAVFTLELPARAAEAV